jgi:hypothetical protein
MSFGGSRHSHGVSGNSLAIFCLLELLLELILDFFALLFLLCNSLLHQLIIRNFRSWLVWLALLIEARSWAMHIILRFGVVTCISGKMLHFRETVFLKRNLI